MHRSSVRLAVDHCQGPRDLKPDYESGAAAFQQPEETGIATNLFVPDFEPLGVLGQRVESVPALCVEWLLVGTKDFLAVRQG